VSCFLSKIGKFTAVKANIVTVSDSLKIGKKVKVSRKAKSVGKKCYKFTDFIY
jgi:hypothetical protein